MSTTQHGIPESFSASPVAIEATHSVPRFHRLRINDVCHETNNAVSIAFEVPAELTEDYRFSPGQNLTLRATIDGEDVRRSYSICSAPSAKELRVAVKRVEDGIFSTWINDTIKMGDEIDVMTPSGRFGLAHALGDGRIHAAFTAGSGITPIFSILHGILETEPNSHFFLFYGNRTTADIMFRDKLEELKDRFLNRLSIFYVLSKEEQDIPILNGRLDRDKVHKLLTSVLPVSMIDHAFICGPSGMIDELEMLLCQLGVAKASIHTERFISAPRNTTRKSRTVVANVAAPTHNATLIIDGKRREVPIFEGESILDAALHAGMDLPFSCKGGMCSTCRAKLVEGDAIMDINYALEPWELEAGFILTCQAHAQSARVVVDFDQV